MPDDPSDEAPKRVPGARNGRVGVYDRPANNRWLLWLALLIAALMLGLGLYAVID